ncbi:hypothetical protein L226DRAFT_134606 [Lentinus tigrinus ALCF2SS1-7]|uniref:uncharacterized protein n=1 Tax=Lentinus tigrinus ALCF2SS1-7 TaxID=1328758 RepID=UPI0011662BBE|nr:hypothetical protein L226DRAFT_134606 [Lentinus tigrinus ALCF2SS1-7]
MDTSEASASSSASSGSPVESPIDLQPPSRSARSSISEHTRRRRSKDDRPNTFSSMRDVARVLISRERETMDLKRTLYTLTEQLKAERQRADAAENKTREVLALFKSANEAKITAEQASARANEELRLYKLQYENAREELRRAQKLIDALEQQRVDAEEVAAKARSMARKLKEERIVIHAKEEGRRQGLEEGLQQGRAMGYEEGRAAGYERGRADTERAYTSAPVTEMDYETPRTRQYEPVQITRPSSSEESEENDPVGNYTQPLDHNLAVPPPVTTPAPVLAQGAAPVVPPRTPPVSIHNVLSPSHPPVDIPPDGWIPSVDDGRIRLPPPHEMAPPPPTPSPPLSAVLNNVKNIPDEPVMIPPPASSEPEHNRRPRHRRRNSNESQSTTMSQFEILGPPSVGSAPSTLRPSARERPAVLSAIAEERERTSSVSSPEYGMPNLSTQSFQMPTPTPGMPVPAPNSPQNPPPPQNPAYPDTTPRYATRSVENLARSSDDYYSRSNTPRYAGTEGSYRSRSPGPDNAYRSRSPGPDNAYRSRSPGPDNAYRSRSPGPDNAYRSRSPEPGTTTPRYEPTRDRGAYDRYGGADTVPRGSTPASIYSVPRGGTPSVQRAPSVGASSAYSVPRGGTPSVQRAPSAGTPSIHRAPSAGPPSVHRYSSRDNMPRVQNIYAPPHSPHSSPESPIPPIVAPAPTLRPHSQQAPENRGSMSSNEINFTIEPPSRPESNISRAEGAEPHRSFLSAEDADRPLPSTPTEPDPSTQPPPVTNPVIPPPVMMSGSWGGPPPGFVPTGPPSPVGSSTVGPAGVPLPPSSYGGSTIGPAGVPLPSSVYGSTPSMRSESVIPGGFPGGEGPPPVIPLQPSSRSSHSAGSSRGAKEPYSRSAIKRRDDDTDSSVSSGMGSADSLTTPPPRTRKLPTRSTTPAYAEAPLPANVQYPVPPTPRSSTSNSLGSYTNRAARVPLPASVSGSVSGSVAGSVVGGPGPTTRSSVLGGMRAPSESGRMRSPLMGGGRNLSSPMASSMSLPVAEPVIPIPIPEPTPITSPVVPASPYRRTTTPLADIDPGPVIPPPVARAPSPVASAVSAATTTNTKGGKKKKRR